MRVLVAEPDARLESFIAQALREESHSVEAARDGDAALERVAEDTAYDLIVLDVTLPKHGGLGVLRMLRGHGLDAPVLLLTASNSTEDTLIGLDAGADAVLAKPFVFDEFLARVRALLRRRSPHRAPLLRAADLVFDPAAHHVSRAGRRIELTAREYALLEYFLRNAGQVLTRDMIAEHVWGRNIESDSNVVDVYVGYLRYKIDGDGGVPLLHTVRGVGYMLGPIR